MTPRSRAFPLRHLIPLLLTAVLLAPLAACAAAGSDSGASGDSAAASVGDADRLADPVLDETRGLIRNDDRATVEYVLYGGLLSDTTYLIDREGRVLHTWKSDYAPSGTAYLLEDGSLLRGAREPDVARFNGGGQGGRIQRISWDGEVTWDYRFADDTQLLHHDIELMPNGNILAISWEYRTAAEARAAGRRVDLTPEQGLWPDKVVELEPLPGNDARIVWEWHTWDHLAQDADPDLPGYGDPATNPRRIDINGTGEAVQVSDEELAQLQALGYVPEDAEAEDLSSDIFHTNAIDYNEAMDQIALSTPEYSEIWIIDHSTTTAEAATGQAGRWGHGGDLLYRWGNPQVYGRGDAASQKFGYQHDVHWIPDGLPGAGNLLVFSNRNGTEEEPHSTVYEIALPTDVEGRFVLPEQDPFGPTEAVWTYTAANPTDFFAPFISGMNRLPSGNTLINSGPQGRFFEATPAGEIVWEYRDPYSGQVRMPDGSLPHPVDTFTYAVFRATPIPADHPALAGRTLAPLDPQPAIPEPPAQEEGDQDDPEQDAAADQQG